MSASSTSTSMNGWTHADWVIETGYGLDVIDAPPPRAADEFSEELIPPQDDVLEILEREESFEFEEDLLIAKNAEMEYDARGIEGTVSYNDYRNRRLGPKP